MIALQHGFVESNPVMRFLFKKLGQPFANFVNEMLFSPTANGEGSARLDVVRSVMYRGRGYASIKFFLVGTHLYSAITGNSGRNPQQG